jgi:hypothetical protein
MNIFLQWHAIFLPSHLDRNTISKTGTGIFSRLVMATSVEMKIIGVDYQVAMI